MPITIGIDLGTTNTAVSYMQNGRPVMLQNDKGYTVFPSIVFWDEKNKVIVGRSARSKMLTKPNRGVYAAKRLMGLRGDSPKVQEIQKRVPYTISTASDGMCVIDVANEKRSPIDIASLILQEAKSIAEKALGEKVTGAVITVPAHFNHAQRDMTKKAAQKANLKCELILNEPTAAALGYGFRQDSEKKVLVYDLGGGTFDVSLLQFDVGVVETLATRGDTFLGGEDFDTRIVNHIAEHFLAQSGVDLREDAIATLRLKDAAEAAKCELSFKEKSKIYIPQIHGGQSIELEYTRAQLEEATEDLIQKTLDVVRQTLEDSKVRISQVDEILLVGGQSRMPRIQQAITNLFNKKASRGVNPDEAVAIGAAVRAGSMDDPSKGGPVLLDVTPFDLGIDISGGLFEKVILRNSKVPSAVTKTFSAVRHNQKVIRIVVRQGESRVAKENEFLGEFRMNDLQPGPRGTISVDVTFEIDSNGMLKVRAVEPQTGEEADITVRNYGEFTQGTGVSLSVQESSQKGATLGSSDTSSSDEEIDSTPQAKSASIQKKVGFFGRLFGSKTEQKIDRLELEEASEDSFEEVVPVSEHTFDDVSEEELLLEDIFEEAPAQQGLADSSFAVQGQEMDSAEIGLVEGGAEEIDLSELLAGDSGSTQSTQDELDDLLIALDDFSEEPLEDEALEGTLDNLLNDLEETTFFERPQASAVELPTAQESDVDVDLDFLDDLGMDDSASAATSTAETEDTGLELDLDFLDEGEEATPAVEEEIDLDFLDEGDVVESSTTPVSEASELDLDLDFLDEREEATPTANEKSTVVAEEEPEIDLDFLDEGEEVTPTEVSSSVPEEELEIDLDFLDEGEEATPAVEEEIDLDFLDEGDVVESSTTPVSEASELDLDLDFLDEREEAETAENSSVKEDELELDLDFLDEGEEATPAVEEEIDLDFLDEGDVVESSTTPVSEASELDLDLDFLDEREEATPTANEKSTVVAEEELEIDLDFLDEGDESISEPATDAVEEEGLDIDLDFLGAGDSSVPELEVAATTEEEVEIDLDFVHTISSEESKDISIAKEDSVSEQENTDHAETILSISSLDEHEQESFSRNEVIANFVKANTQTLDVFSIQDDGFFAEETPSRSVQAPKEEADAPIEIPTTVAETTDETEIDLDFFDDLFDD